MHKKTHDILVAGEINPDLILSHPNFPLHFQQEEILLEAAALEIGSSNAIFACGAARLGLRVALVGVVGDDIFGRFMLDALSQRGVNITNVIVDPDQKTGFSVILTQGGGRSILTYMGAINALQAEQIPDQLLSQARHLHVASYFLQTNLQPGLPDLFRRARRLGLTTSLDTNWDPGEQWAGVHNMLPLTDIFLPNENEACELMETENVEIAARGLAARTKIVAVKMGAEGGLVVQGDRFHRAPALPIEVVDTVGAGDSFDAGFTYGFLHGWSLTESLKLAIVCGSLSTLKPGGVEGQPTLDAAQKF